MDAGTGGDAAEPICGDGICAPSEASSCPADCGSGSGSGGPCNHDGFCEPAMGETNTSCPDDCDYVCGNGLCESGETETSCPADCGPRPFDCTDVYSQAACYACFKDDAQYGVGECDADSDVSGGNADDCAACVGSGVFGSGCGSACASGESAVCAQCMAFSQSCGDGTCQQVYGETTDNCPADCTFDCDLAGTQAACQTCLGDDYYYGSGECDSEGEAYPGSAADCAACVGSGFGSDGSACAAYCGSGETADCAQCVSAQQYCGDDSCDTFYGENSTFCPVDCNAVCGDGICQTSQGENSSNCSDDCFVDCTSPSTASQCYACFEDDFENSAGECEDFDDVEDPLTADGCATCVATGEFGSGFGSDSCAAACSAGETDACAHCMHNLAPTVFDCADPYTLHACQQCYADNASFGSGACDAFYDVYPGSAADCAVCLPPATNDTCATAIALTVDTLVNGTTFGATSDYETSGGDCPSERGGGPDVVYSVELTAGTAYTFTAQGTFDVVLSVVGPGASTVCDAEETACVDGADDGIGDESFSYTPSTSGTYFVIVDTYSAFDAEGTFTVEVDD